MKTHPLVATKSNWNVLEGKIPAHQSDKSSRVRVASGGRISCENQEEWALTTWQILLSVEGFRFLQPERIHHHAVSINVLPSATLRGRQITDRSLTTQLADRGSWCFIYLTNWVSFSIRGWLTAMEAMQIITISSIYIPCPYININKIYDYISSIN